MNTHCSDSQLAQALAGDRTPEIDAHLDACAACRQEFAQMAAITAALRQAAGASVSPDAWFWERQAARVRARIEPRQTWMRLALASAAALIVVASVLLQGGAPAPQAQRIDDNDLLVHIERQLEKDISSPLTATAMLVEEMQGAQQSSTETYGEESGYEN